MVGATHPRRSRGRPRKFSDPSRPVALTLPEHAIRALKRINRDLAWAIVSLLGKREQRRPTEPLGLDAELVAVANRRSLIVVNSDVVKKLPGVSIIPLNGHRAFLALDPGKGMADLELAVADRLGQRRLGARERKALEALRRLVAKWRRTRSAHVHSRSIIVVEDRR
jgi:hypothetical protein